MKIKAQSDISSNIVLKKDKKDLKVRKSSYVVKISLDSHIIRYPHTTT